MKKAWSLSTTVRNPERILPFLKVLQEMEGNNFDKSGQVKFQTLLIQNRLYKPIGMSNKLQGYYDTTEDKMSSKQAEEIFNFMKSKSTELSKDPGLRGRTSVAPLTKMGLAIAKKTTGEIAITELGKAFLSDKVDIGDVYFKFFIKWQLPNPETNGFKMKDGYDIKPFIGVLHLINAVNNKAEKPKGISKKEFSLFAPTLISYKNIENYATQIISLRKKMIGKSVKDQKIIFDTFKENFIGNFLQTDDLEVIQTFAKTLKDYGDSAIRNFHLTRYIYIRGGGFYVDTEERRSIEINSLLESDNGQSLEFENKNEYIEYVRDITQPKLPWENKDKYIEIIKKLVANINEYEQDLGLANKEIKDYSSLNESELKLYIEELRVYRRSIQEDKNHQESQGVDQIKDYINKLENIFNLDSRPIMLEKYSTYALNSLNDAIKIQPNYPVGDDNEPTFTAPANVPDIECFYEKYNAICEVTMLVGRDQWYNEGQPVMRHLRDFEDKNNTKDTYCVFIAPKMHRDTINTYLTAIKHGYEGKKQKIVPLSITNLIKILKILIQIKEKGKFLTHNVLFDLYNKIIIEGENINEPVEWLSTIPNTIDSWKKTLIQK